MKIHWQKLGVMTLVTTGVLAVLSYMSYNVALFGQSAYESSILLAGGFLYWAWDTTEKLS